MVNKFGKTEKQHIFNIAKDSIEKEGIREWTRSSFNGIYQIVRTEITHGCLRKMQIKR